MKVAIVHYWLVNYRGGEKVLESLCRLFPDADVYTHVGVKEVYEERIPNRVFETWIAKLPCSRKYYKLYLPLMPYALESLDLSEYDLIISSESGPAKGVIPPPGALHICYCHSPMRYIWDQYTAYTSGASLFKRVLSGWYAHKLRLWDYASAARVDHFIANSSIVAARIKSYYRRDADVIFPPVEFNRFAGVRAADHKNAFTQSEPYYLWLGELVDYKRPDLAIAACERLGRRLLVIGGGAEKYTSHNGGVVEFLGKAPDDVVEDCIRGCRALLFPGVEDFGIVPLEVMACGKPVLAYGKGGVLDTVLPGQTGLFFDEQTVESIVEVMSEFEMVWESSFIAEDIAAHAATFDVTLFEAKVREYIECVTGETRTLPAKAEAPPRPERALGRA